MGGGGGWAAHQTSTSPCENGPDSCRAVSDPMVISRSTLPNYLGVIIDEKLSFDDMVDAKYNKINVRIHQLGKLRKYINSEIAQVIYKQMILPLFNYADFMVESARKPKIDKLEKLQEKGIRYVDNDIHYNTDIETLYCTDNIQKLSMRYKEYLSCIMYRYSKLSDKLEYSRLSIYLQSNKKVNFKKLHKRKYEQYLKSPLVCGVKVWEQEPAVAVTGGTPVINLLVLGLPFLAAI